MDPAEARTRFTAARHAVLGTADAAGVPHLVPVTFASVNDHVYIAIDHKPKRGTDLRRLRNIAANPEVTLLVEHYEDDWDKLWWVRADGTGTVLDSPAAEPGLIAALQAKYPQYVERPPHGEVIAVAVRRWSGWTGGPAGAAAGGGPA